MFTAKILSSLAVGALGLVTLTTLNAQADTVVNNPYLDDTVIPLALPADYVLGFNLKNTSNSPADISITMPVTFFDQNGEPLAATQEPGTMKIRKIVDRDSRFNYQAISGEPFADELEITIQLSPVELNNTLFGDSLRYGYMSFDIHGLNIEPDQSVFTAIDFVPSNALAAIVFLNNGMDPQNTGYLLPNVETAWFTGSTYTGDLLYSDDFGPNRVLAMSYQTIPVPEPQTAHLLAAGLGYLLLLSRA
ncbi:MAG: hypothetical protein HC898_08800 [Phycisphaerales bacterium]|nr:hypothetical protein [Phycisphaerales bacterium]